MGGGETLGEKIVKAAKIIYSFPLSTSQSDFLRIANGINDFLAIAANGLALRLQTHRLYKFFFWLPQKEKVSSCRLGTGLTFSQKDAELTSNFRLFCFICKKEFKRGTTELFPGSNP